MARLSAAEKHSNAVLVLSSDDEEENEEPSVAQSSDNLDLPENLESHSDFISLTNIFREKLKDERRAEILTRMYQNASAVFKTSGDFKSFIKDMANEIEKATDDRAHLLLLMTSICQTLSVGEVIWSAKTDNIQVAEANKITAEEEVSSDKDKTNNHHSAINKYADEESNESSTESGKICKSGNTARKSCKGSCSKKKEDFKKSLSIKDKRTVLKRNIPVGQKKLENKDTRNFEYNMPKVSNLSRLTSSPSKPTIESHGKKSTCSDVRKETLFDKGRLPSENVQCAKRNLEGKDSRISQQNVSQVSTPYRLISSPSKDASHGSTMNTSNNGREAACESANSSPPLKSHVSSGGTVPRRKQFLKAKELLDKSKTDSPSPPPLCTQSSTCKEKSHCAQKSERNSGLLLNSQDSHCKSSLDSILEILSPSETEVKSIRMSPFDRISHTLKEISASRNGTKLIRKNSNPQTGNVQIEKSKVQPEKSTYEVTVIADSDSSSEESDSSDDFDISLSESTYSKSLRVTEQQTVGKTHEESIEFSSEVTSKNRDTSTAAHSNPINLQCDQREAEVSSTDIPNHSSKVKEKERAKKDQTSGNDHVDIGSGDSSETDEAVIVAYSNPVSKESCNKSEMLCERANSKQNVSSGNHPCYVINDGSEKHARDGGVTKTPDNTLITNTVKRKCQSKNIKEIVNILKERVEKKGSKKIEVNLARDDDEEMTSENYVKTSCKKKYESESDGSSNVCSEQPARDNKVILVLDDSDNDDDDEITDVRKSNERSTASNATKADDEISSVNEKRSDFSDKVSDLPKDKASVPTKEVSSINRSSPTLPTSSLSSVNESNSTSTSKELSDSTEISISNEASSSNNTSLETVQEEKESPVPVNNKFLARKSSEISVNNEPSSSNNTYLETVQEEKESPVPVNNKFSARKSSEISVNNEPSSSNNTSLETVQEEKESPVPVNNKFSARKLTKKAKIKKLECELEILEQKINKCARQELSFRDMISEESPYITEANLKERFLKKWRIYCMLTGEDADSIVYGRKKVKVTSSPFAQLNSAVEKYINKSDIFPNLFEVKQVCTQANIKYGLELKPNDLHNCTVDIFSEVGRKLQKRRVKEFRTTSGNILTDHVKIDDDPALLDENLKRKLKQNRKIAKQRTEEVFKDFVRQQYEQATAGLDRSNESDSDAMCSDSDIQMSDSDAILENLRKKDLIVNKDIKRSLANKNAGVEQVKKKKILRDKTIISLTLSSSQELDEPLSNKKIDYQVTIDSSSPNSMSIYQSKGDADSKSKSQPICSPQIKSSSSQGKCSFKKNNIPRDRADISPSVEDIIGRKDKVTINESQVSSSFKRKRISLSSDKYNMNAAASNFERYKSPKDDSKKRKNDGSLYKQFSKKINVQPSLSPKVILGTEESDKTPSATYSSPLSMFRKKTIQEVTGKNSTSSSTTNDTSSSITIKDLPIVIDDVDP